MLRLLLIVSVLLASAVILTAAPVAYPGTVWKKENPASAGLDASLLREFAKRVGGDGCVIRNGVMVHEWGDVTSNRDWASAAKPVLATLLLIAVNNRLLPSPDTPVRTVGWPLQGKDAGITFSQLANMTSGYARGEAPGTAWSYNDYGIQLLARSLERVFKCPLDEAARRHLAPLQFQDSTIFASRNGLGLTLSPRDMARLGWLWLNEGRWKDRKIVSNKLFHRGIRIQVPASLPLSQQPGQDYLGIGTYGGGAFQSTNGPGVYGMGFWFNGLLPNGRRTWPSLPADTFQANGAWNRDTVTVFPSLNMVVVTSMADRPGKFSPGSKGTGDRNFRMLIDALKDPPRRE